MGNTTEQEFSQLLEKWSDAVAERIGKEEKILPLNSGPDSWPWSEHDDIFWISQDVRRTAFEKLLTDDPNDLARRFTVLSICEHFREFVPYGIEPLDEEQEAQEDWLVDYEFFLETCDLKRLNTWDRAYFELENARAVGAYYFAESIWQQVIEQKLLDSSIWFRRGTYRFLSYFASSLKRKLRNLIDGNFEGADDLYGEFLPFLEKMEPLKGEIGKYLPADITVASLWRLEAAPGDSYAERILQKWCASSLDEVINPWNKDSHERLAGAIEDLARVEDSEAKKSVLLPMARALHELEKYVESAQKFEASIATSGGRIKSFYLAAASGYVEAGQTVRAKNLLLECASAFPTSSGIYEQLSKISAKECNHDEAALYLAQEAERNPAVSEDYRSSIVVALQGMRPPRAIVQEVIEAFLGSEHARTVQNVIEQYWPTFELLNQGSKENWLAGVMLGWDHKEPKLKRAFAERAVQCLSKVVETELREEVFATFKRKVQKANRLLDGNCRLRDYVYDGGSLTLGEMIVSIRTCYNSGYSIYKEFRGHLGTGYQVPPYLSDLEANTRA